MSTSDVLSLNQKLDQVITQNEALAETQDKMLFIISGNPLDSRDRGMLGRLDKVEKNQESFRKYYWMGMGAMLVVGYLLQYVFQYFKH